MKDSPFIGAEDWRGSHIALADLPALSYYVQRALRADAQAGLQTLERSAENSWTAARLREALQALLAADAGDASQRLAVALRRLRRQVMLTLVARDATGRADLAEVVGTMTALAELSVQTADHGSGA